MKFDFKKQKDVFWMKRALRLAEKGWGTAQPNPVVGAVVLDKKGRKISEGYHQSFGSSHAEVNALKRVLKVSRGGTLYVTLEPCSTFGKTPPCTDLIIKSGIKRVVVGAIDPNPRHKGRGVRLLKRKGIHVTNGLLAEEVERQNAFFFKFMRSGTPFVTLKLAQSLDGKIATSSGESKWITGPASRKRVQVLRQNHGAILVGTNTLKNDKPSLRVRGFKGLHPRRIFVAREPKAIKDYLLAMDHPNDFLFYGSPYKFRLKHMTQIKAPFDQKGVSLPFMIKKLAAAGITSLLVEGGGEMAAELLRGNWVDEVYFFIAPIIIGGRDAKTSVGGEGFGSLAKAFHLKDVQTEYLGSDILLRGFVKKTRKIGRC